MGLDNIPYAKFRCSGCGEMFRSEAAFNAHREGTFEPDERRCLDASSIVAKGYGKDENGIWGQVDNE